tara:strand:- start:469 stop:633 length:165 start_codon:yes stop_codon:yes gene_type:complete
MVVEAGLSDLGSWHCLTYCQEKTLQKALAADLLGAKALGLEAFFETQDQKTHPS